MYETYLCFDSQLIELYCWNIIIFCFKMMSWLSYYVPFLYIYFYYCYYMSPPAGDIYCFSLRVCASVRPFVCNAFLSAPYLQEPFVQKNLQNIPKITYLLKLCNEKVKIQFCQKFWKFWPKKNTFGIWCFVQARSQ